MMQNCFLQILQFLHFEDRCKKGTSNDKMWKLRFIADYLQANMFKHFHLLQQLSYYESLMPHFERHGSKRFIRDESLSCVYKVWSLFTPIGYLIYCEIYLSDRKHEIFLENAFVHVDVSTPDVQLPFFHFGNLFPKLHC